MAHMLCYFNYKSMLSASIDSGGPHLARHSSPLDHEQGASNVTVTLKTLTMPLNATAYDRTLTTLLQKGAPS